MFVMNLFSMKLGRHQKPVSILGKRKINDLNIIKVKFPNGHQLWMPVSDFEHKCIVTLNLRKFKNIY